MIKIRDQLGRYFTLISIASIAFITIVSNLSMNIFFSSYLQNSRNSDDRVLVDYIRELNEEENGLSETDKMSIEHYAFNLQTEVIVLDPAGSVVIASGNPEGVSEGLTSPSDYIDDTKFNYKTYDYGEGEPALGDILIGRPKTIFVTSEDRRFAYTINGIYLAAAIISVAIGMMLKNRVSSTFLKPIYAIQDNAKYIEDGEFRKVMDVETRTLELDSLSHSINDMALRLEQQERIRKRMTADIAHELRTPLATLNSHIEAFLDGVWEPTPDRLVIIQDEITRLTKLLRDLGDLSTFENEEARLDLKEVQLSPLLENIIESFEPLFIGKEIALEKEIEDGLSIQGDTDRLNQVFINVISNALKYTDKGGTVFVGLQKEGENVMVTVRDNGMGIRKEDLPFVFERFYRGDRSRSRETGGKGIGLTITKALVEAHQGTIRISSAETGGTTVTIRFPGRPEGNGNKI
ncbi:MAG TPA: ATP-binding protein [Clostridiaceae bacterium]|nr:ATP-binding protein [Clostridiaceae bacterium]